MFKIQTTNWFEWAKKIISSIGDGGSGAFLQIAPKPSHPYTTFPSNGPSNGFYILCSHWKTI